ncbi:MAG: hypothetical protein ACI8W8_000576 [Rhodothermales bacterium]|jgi:hypothetical protein
MNTVSVCRSREARCLDAVGIANDGEEIAGERIAVICGGDWGEQAQDARKISGLIVACEKGQ